MHAYCLPSPQAVVIQDMKTEDSSVPGGYALPCVTRGSVVLVRGADDAGATVTWVAEVRKVGGTGSVLAPLAALCWGATGRPAACGCLAALSAAAHPPPRAPLKVPPPACPPRVASTQIYRAGGSKLKADIRWFYRRSDVPEKAARRLVLVDEAREVRRGACTSTHQRVVWCHLLFNLFEAVVWQQFGSRSGRCSCGA